MNNLIKFTALFMAFMPFAIFANSQNTDVVPPPSDSLGYSIAPPVTFSQFSPVTGILLTVVNQNSNNVLSASLKHITIGMGAYASDKPLPTENGYSDVDLTNNIVFSPRVLAMLPNQNGTIRLMIKRPHNLPEGTYWVNLSLLPKAPPVKTNTLLKGESSAAAGVLIALQYNVYLQNGTGNANAAQVTCKKDAKTLNLAIKNSTSYLFRASVSVLHNGKTITTQIPTPLLPYSEGTRNITLPSSPESGPYSITWNLPDLAGHSLVCQ